MTHFGCQNRCKIDAKSYRNFNRKLTPQNIDQRCHQTNFPAFYLRFFYIWGPIFGPFWGPFWIQGCDSGRVQKVKYLLKFMAPPKMSIFGECLKRNAIFGPPKLTPRRRNWTPGPSPLEAPCSGAAFRWIIVKKLLIGRPVRGQNTFLPVRGGM